MATVSDEHKSHRMGLHTERLAGRTQQVFFSPEDAEYFVYHGSFEVDFNKRAEFDADWALLVSHWSVQSNAAVKLTTLMLTKAPKTRASHAPRH